MRKGKPSHSRTALGSITSPPSMTTCSGLSSSMPRLMSASVMATCKHTTHFSLPENCEELLKQPRGCSTLLTCLCASRTKRVEGGDVLVLNGGCMLLPYMPLSGQTDLWCSWHRVLHDNPDYGASLTIAEVELQHTLAPCLAIIPACMLVCWHVRRPIGALQSQCDHVHA